MGDTIEKYGVAEDDIFNFDETGFQMGVISTSKVITTSERKGRPRQKEPESMMRRVLDHGIAGMIEKGDGKGGYLTFIRLTRTHGSIVGKTTF